MLDHVGFQCADLARSAAFYDAVLAPLGGTRLMDFGVAYGYGIPPMPDFWISIFDSGEGFRESHIAFRAPDRATVHAFFDAAVAAGAEVLHEPREWPEYHPGYYGAFVRDPDGNFFFAARAAGLPTTFLITPDGEIVASRTKAFSSLSELQGWIDRSRP